METSRRPSIKRTGTPIEITDYAPFNSNTGPRRRLTEYAAWVCKCGHENPRWRVQCQYCMSRRT